MTGQPDFERYRPHPWHGLSPGREPPRLLRTFVEITPFDSVKYETDKATGYLRVDRPQRSSSLPPALYGFVPQTFCGPRVAALSGVAEADGDPLDICVLSERPINHPEVLLDSRVVGGIRLIDHGVADDKIIAVLENDAVWGAADDVDDLPARLVERLVHFFGTYKMVPGAPSPAFVQAVYGVAHAERVVLAALEDYRETFGPPPDAEPASEVPPDSAQG